MKQIIGITIVVIIALGYMLPIPQIKDPIDYTITASIAEMKTWDWLFSDDDCEDQLVKGEMDKGFCRE